MTSPGSRLLAGTPRRHETRALLYALLLGASLAGIHETLWGAEGGELLGVPAVEGGAPQGGDAGDRNPFHEFLNAFTDVSSVADVSISLLLAAILGAIIAYHPRVYGKASTLEEVDQPKIFIMYAVVGALVGFVVSAYPQTALVIFGIGGLLRFRTDVGAARDTGRVILVTIVGLGCGLKIYLVVVLATLFAWILIYILEGRKTHRMLVKGLEQSLLAQAAEAYLEVLRENELTVMSQKKNFLKGQVAFVFRAPGEIDLEELEGLFKDIPPKLQGAVDWESN